MTEIIEKERPDAILPNLGGQTGLNLTSELHKTGVLEKYGVKVIGVQVDAIERGEDRMAFKETMNRLGIDMPESEIAYSVEEAENDRRRARLPGRDPPRLHHGRHGRRAGLQHRGASGRRRPGPGGEPGRARSSSRSRSSAGRSWSWRSSATPRTR